MPERRALRVGDRVRVVRSTVNPDANGRVGVVTEGPRSTRGRAEVIVNGPNMAGPWYVDSLDLIESASDAATATPRRPVVGDRVRITQYEHGAPVGEVVEVEIVETNSVRYRNPVYRGQAVATRGNTLYAHDYAYELIVIEPADARAAIEEKLTAYRGAPTLAAKVVAEELEWVLTLIP